MCAIFTYDFVNETIVGSKNSIKKAGIPSSKEYKELMSMKKRQPTFKVVEKEVRTNDNKKTYKGLTIQMMRDYVEQENANLLDEFIEVVEIAKTLHCAYPMAKKWFLAQFPTYTMKEGKKAKSNAGLKKVSIKKHTVTTKRVDQ